MVDKLSLSPLRHVERSLALNQPFGDSHYISDRLHQRYTRRLQSLAPFVQQAARAAEALAVTDESTGRPVLADPLVRSIINRAVAHFTMNIPYSAPEHFGDVLDVVALSCVERQAAPPLHRAVGTAKRLGDAEHHGWIWNEAERPDDVMTRGYRALFEQYLGVTGLRLSTPSPADYAALKEGMTLLDALLPKLAFSALRHAQLVVLVDHPPGFVSVTNQFIAGTIFLSRAVVSTPWSAAEYLLHEALHQKYIDLEQVLAFHRRPEHPNLINPPWRRSKINSPNAWTVKRSLTVMHVYTALSLFFRMLTDRRQELERTYPGVRSVDLPAWIRRSHDRASYLVREVNQRADELGPAGLRFVSWLSELLDDLDSAPREHGTNGRLALDLYGRETEYIGSLLAGMSPAPVEARRIARAHVYRLLAHDLTATCAIAGELARTLPWLAHVQNRLGDINEDAWSAFVGEWWSTRALVSQKLGSFAENDTISLAGRAAPVGEHIATMVKDAAPLIEDVVASSQSSAPKRDHAATAA